MEFQLGIAYVAHFVKSSYWAHKVVLESMVFSDRKTIFSPGSKKFVLGCLNLSFSLPWDISHKKSEILLYWK